MDGLTTKQGRIHAFLCGHIERHGLPPTTLEIQKRFGFASDKAARDHLGALARKGYIEVMPGKARGIRVLRPLPSDTLPGQLPLVGRVAAGSPVLAPENIENWYRVDPNLFRPRANFLFRVHGHSMKDANILDGDLVGISQRQEAQNGQIVVARVANSRTGEDEITLKRYLRRGNVVVLKPENSSGGYEPIEIDLTKHDADSQERPSVGVEGIFVGLIRVSLGAGV